MKKIICSLFLLLSSSFACAAVIDFDDLSGNTVESIADGYQGFNWVTLASVNKNNYLGTGYAAGTVSGNNAVFNQFGNSISISLASDGSFDFIGAFFTSAWVSDYFHEISFEGWLGGAVIYSLDSAQAITSDTPTWIQLDWAGIDQLTIYSNLDGWSQWVMDDFTVSINNASVPESSSLVLLLMGLIGVSLLRRQR